MNVPVTCGGGGAMATDWTFLTGGAEAGEEGHRAEGVHHVVHVVPVARPLVTARSESLVEDEVEQPPLAEGGTPIVVGRSAWITTSTMRPPRPAPGPSCSGRERKAPIPSSSVCSKK